jgi:hypothetical protein
MKLLLAFTTLFFLSCTRPTETNTSSSTTEDTTEISQDANVALNFINDYSAFCNQKDQDANWIKNNALLTENFKSTYYHLLDSARKEDPELGLGFDPIFDAQDFPDKGFVVVNQDNATGFVTIKGKDLPEFMLVLKVSEQNGKFLVDGSGVINIPVNKRAKR